MKTCWLGIGGERGRRVKSLAGEAIFDPLRHFIGSPAGGEKKELLMECSHLVDPVAVSGRKAGDR